MTNPACVLRVVTAAANAKVPVILWGPPGVGKTALIQSLAERCGLICEVVIGSSREPTDFNGLPVVSNGKDADDSTRNVWMVPPDWFYRLKAAGRGFLFLDELSNAPPAVQAAMLRVLAEREVGSQKLPDGVVIVAAANPPEQAADGWDLTLPAANRFLHIDYSPTAETWIKGMTEGFDRLGLSDTKSRISTAEGSDREVRRDLSRALLGRFISTQPQLLYKLPTDASAASRAWPSWRTWTWAADVLAELDDNDHEAARMALFGLVGEGSAVEFLTWRKFGDLPEPAEVLANPALVDWASERTDRAFAILSAVVEHVNGLGTVEAWQAGCDLLAGVAKAGVADVAAVAVRTLVKYRPSGARPPASLRKGFETVLADAGLMTAVRTAA